MLLDIPLSQAERIRRYYLCSDCWEPLIESSQDRQTISLSCFTANCPNRGMVSVQYVERREREARVLVRNMRKELASELAWVKPIPKRTSPQLLTMLGYY